MQYRLYGCIAAAFFLSAPALALDLRLAYSNALSADAQFKAAVNERNAGLVSRELGRSALLPQVQWTYSNSSNQLDRTSTDNAGRPLTDSRDYRSSTNVLSVRQPLVNFDALARYRQGLAQSEQSLAVFDSQTNALAIRLIEAYSNVMLSIEQVALVEAESAAYLELMKANESLWKKGEGTRTDAIETRSKYLVSQAQLLEVQGNLDTARRQLEGIVGADLRPAIASMRSMTRVFKMDALPALSIESWQDRALEGSPDVRALRSALEAARQDVERARAGHMLRVDLVASVSRSLSETTMTINQNLNIQSAGVQLTLPIYSGGSVDATTRQAGSNYQKAQAQLEARINDVMVDLRKQFNLSTSGASKIKALEAAIESAETQVLAMRKSILGGQRVNIDLLNAIQQLRLVKREHAMARHAYINSLVRLMAHTGPIGEKEMSDFSGFFAP